MDACHAILSIDSEENGMVAQRVLFDMHKTYKQALEEQSGPFFTWLQQVCGLSGGRAGRRAGGRAIKTVCLEDSWLCAIGVLSLLLAQQSVLTACLAPPAFACLPACSCTAICHRSLRPSWARGPRPAPAETARCPPTAPSSLPLKWH
jgi:hypothetical protein